MQPGSNKNERASRGDVLLRLPPGAPGNVLDSSFQGAKHAGHGTNNFDRKVPTSPTQLSGLTEFCVQY